jgi:Raf kinase inhibitor-like YbhB/YbcL family protein
MRLRLSHSIFMIGLLVLLPAAWAQDQLPVSPNLNHIHTLHVSSTTFTNNGTIPLNMVWNQCTAYPGGANQSPELSWAGVPHRTRSFIVVVYDVTASFTHWGMYNISRSTTSLPLNAGVAASTYGPQISNDFGDLNYDGPCPPTTLTPLSHEYVVSVYALDIMLPVLPSYGDFPPGAEALYHAMIAAGIGGDILDVASTKGYFPAP